ncbi:MAG: dynamin family protein [Armatimonadota bacterium]
MSITQVADQVANTCRWLIDMRETIGIAQSPSEAELHDLSIRLSSPRFEIGVVGLQGHGKSALVNALLGDRIVYSGPQIAQNRIIRIAYGEPLVRLIKDDVTLREFPISELGNMGCRGGVEVESGVQILATIISDILRDGVCIADTPGGDAGIDREADDAEVESYLKNASVVLVASHATKPGLAKIFHFIDDAGRNTSDLVVALTASDLLDEDSLEEAVQTTERQMRTHFGRDIPVCPVSAEEALRERNEDHEAVIGIESLRQRLRRLALRAQVGMAARAFFIIEHVGSEWRDMCLTNIQKGAEEIRRLKERYKSEIDAGKAESAKMVRMLECVARIRDDALEDVASPLWDLRGANDRIDGYLQGMGIVDINNKLGNYASTLLNELIKSATQQIACLLEDYASALERQLASVGIKMTLDSKPNLGAGSKAVRISPQPTGTLAWIEDPDDSKRRASASRDAKSQLAIASKRTAYEVTNKAKQHILALEKRCESCVNTATALAEQIVQSALHDLQAEEAEQQSRQNEQQKLNQLLFEADEQLEPMRVIAFILKQLDLPQCAAVVDVAKDSSNVDLGGFENLVLCLKEVASKYPEASDEVSSFWAHMQAGLFYIEVQQLDEAHRQAELARELSDCISTKQRLLPIKLEAEVIRKQSGIDASLDYLQTNCSHEELVPERIVASLFAGKRHSLRSILDNSKQSELDERLRLIVGYVLGSNGLSPIDLANADGMTMLAECHRKFDVEAYIEPFCEAVRSDQSIERHVVSRIRQWAKLNSEDHDIVIRAYGQVQTLEELLPVSAINELDMILSISKAV